MSESTLAMAKKDFQVKTAVYLGWGRGADYGEPAWSDFQTYHLKEFVDTACREFYWPALPGGQAYDWSFMRPVLTLQLPLGVVTLPLPDDFGGMEGELTLSVATNNRYLPVPFVNVGQVYERFSSDPQAVGYPIMVCVDPLKESPGPSGQRFQLHFWPTPDQVYQVQFQYYLLPDALSDDSPYAYGGASHTQTILQGCKAAAETALDDIPDGPHRALFRERLLASIEQDRRMKPQLMPYNGDRSDWRRRMPGDRRMEHYLDSNPVTFDGTAYP